LSFESLLPALADPEHRPPAGDLASLSGLAEPDLRRFFETWQGLSIQRRRDIIDSLLTLAEDNVDLDFTPIFRHGMDDPDVQVRAESIKGLWEQDDPDAARRLLERLGDPEALVRSQAALTLGGFLMQAELMDIDSPILQEIERELRRIVHDEREISEVRGRALEALGARSGEWVSDLIDEAYASGDRRLAISAVHAMGRNASTSWLPTLIEEMQSEDGEMRFEAATAAGGIADEAAVPYLAPLTDDDDPEVQEAAIMALGEIGGSAAREVLSEVAGSSDERVLEAVRDALALADFDEDPLGYKMYLDDSVAADAEEDDE
jgi:HEAT repeat protein